MAGILTIFSAVFLVLHYVKLDQMIEDKFERMFKQQPTWNLQVSDRNQFHEIFFNDLTKFLFFFSDYCINDHFSCHCSQFIGVLWKYW